MKRFMILAGVALLVGCGGPKVRYADPNETETVNEDLGRTDIQKTVKTMVNSMIRVAGSEFSNRPYIAVSQVANKTNENFDTRMITDLVREGLLESGLFRFTTEDKDLKDNLERVEAQESSGLYKQNERTASKGNWNPPEYVMRGRITEIEKRNDDVKDVYYQITIWCDNVNEASIVWQKTEKINKRVDR